MREEIIVPEEEEIIGAKIYEMRGQKVMLDTDLAELYQVETKVLNQAVKRNINRFPDDFMFQLNAGEFTNLKSQIVTSSWGGRRTLPYVFTEHGILMLSSVLRSDRAVAVNIHIMRVFMKMREMISSHQDLIIKMEELEKRVSDQDGKIIQVLKYLKQFVTEKQKPREQIGFKQK